MLYNIVLALHNIVRWVVLITAILALVRAYMGWLQNREWSARDRQSGVFFTSALDTQLLLGLILFFISPWTRALLTGNFTGMMSDPTMQFFSIEHVPFMILAVVLAHIGSARARGATDAASKFRQSAIFFSLSVLVIILIIPWWRPLFPGLGGV
jgi:quinol-cytochrome oxidoreductase complex cytochrome b subunit